MSEAAGLRDSGDGGDRRNRSINHALPLSDGSCCSHILVIFASGLIRMG